MNVGTHPLILTWIKLCRNFRENNWMRRALESVKISLYQELLLRPREGRGNSQKMSSVCDYSSLKISTSATVQHFWSGIWKNWTIEAKNGVNDLHTVLSLCSQLIYSHFHCWKTQWIPWPASLIKNIPFFPMCCSWCSHNRSFRALRDCVNWIEWYGRLLVHKCKGKAEGVYFQNRRHWSCDNVPLPWLHFY